MQNLFIFTNTFLLMEFISLKDFKNKKISITIDMAYNKNNYELIDYANKLITKGLFNKYIEYDSFCKETYDTINIPSSVYPETITKLKHTKFNEIILLEEGMYDYVSGELVHTEPEIFLNRIKYVNNPEKSLFNELYKEINKINFDEESLSIIKDILTDDLKLLPEKLDLIVFTDPLDIDFGFKHKNILIKKLEKEYTGKNILFKKHPRDLNNYKSNKYNYFENSNISGQIIEKLYDCEKVFIYPSTILLTIENLSKIKLFTFDIKDKKYEEIINSDIIKEIEKININQLLI